MPIIHPSLDTAKAARALYEWLFGPQPQAMAPPSNEPPVMGAGAQTPPELSMRDYIDLMRDAEMRQEENMRIRRRNEILSSNKATYGQKAVAGVAPYLDRAAAQSATSNILGLAGLQHTPKWGPEFEGTASTLLSLPYSIPAYMASGLTGSPAATMGIPAGLGAAGQVRSQGGGWADAFGTGAIEGGKGAILGQLMGWANQALAKPRLFRETVDINKLLRPVVNTGIMGVGGPALEGRIPTIDDLAKAGAVVGASTLAAGALNAAKGREYRPYGKGSFKYKRDPSGKYLRVFRGTPDIANEGLATDVTWASTGSPKAGAERPKPGTMYLSTKEKVATHFAEYNERPGLVTEYRIPLKWAQDMIDAGKLRGLSNAPRDTGIGSVDAELWLEAPMPREFIWDIRKVSKARGVLGDNPQQQGSR